MLMKKKYKIGLVIGRFQPLHNGHVWLVHKALEHCERIKIGIGSSNVSDESNPYNFEKRKKMAEDFLEEAGLQDKVLSIFPVADFHNDQKWLSEVQKQAGEFDVVIGNNEWTNGILEKAGYEVIRPGHFNRKELEGIKIRKLIKEEKPWQQFVPKSVGKDL